jgi:Rrf2 family transcriptional regulator, nitric oxide-sensitive transcriptional repressor
MRLNRTSDFALRLMMLLAGTNNALSVEGAALRLKIPRSQVMKITAALSAAGFVETRRGRGGGIRLQRPASEVQIGAVVRAMENDLGVVDCLRSAPCDCVFLPRCGLIRAMSGATESFLAHLDGFTLSEVAERTLQPVQLVR